MTTFGTANRRALVVDGRGSVRDPMVHFLQLHGMDVALVDGFTTATQALAETSGFHLALAPVRMWESLGDEDWRGFVEALGRTPLLVHGTAPPTAWSKLTPKPAVWLFLSSPFSLFDFHRAVFELLRPVDFQAFAGEGRRP